MRSDRHSNEQPHGSANERSNGSRLSSASESRPDKAISGDVSDFSIPAIEFRDVDFSYDDNRVLKALSFQVARGEIKIILSASGGGKSTILKLILGLLKPDAGQILIDGEDISGYDETEWQRARDKMGMVFQEGALFDSLSVYDNVAYRLHEREIPEENTESEVRSLLQFVNLEEEIEKLPTELSGGMQKRVGIARALVGNPSIVLFDEPTVALDPPASGTICDLIIELRDLENVSSIIVTHEMDVVKYLASEYIMVSDEGKIQFKDEGQELCLTNTNILMLRDGRAIFSGTSTQLIESEDPYIQEFIRGTELLPKIDESQDKQASPQDQRASLQDQRISHPHSLSK